MSATDKLFAGSIPENYDGYMVPLIFASFAGDIARRAAEISPATVLETAAGSGVVTRALAPRLAPDARYVVTDLNQPMLDYAAARQGADGRISWRKALHHNSSISHMHTNKLPNVAIYFDHSFLHETSDLVSRVSMNYYRSASHSLTATPISSTHIITRAPFNHYTSTFHHGTYPRTSIPRGH